MNRNQQRLLTEAQIEALKKQVAQDLVDYADDSASILVDIYLTGDAEELMVNVSTWIESAEDSIFAEINTETTEEVFKKIQEEGGEEF